MARTIAWVAAVLVAALLSGSSSASQMDAQPFPAQDSLQAATAGVSVGSFENTTGAASWHRKLQQLPKSPSAQIFLDGVLQEAKLDPKCADQPTCGGSLVVNGISVVVPNNAMVFFPANALTWQEMFTGGSSGLAASDKPAGGPYIVSVTANRVAASGQIIAGLIDIAQDPLVTGSGYIEAIDYAAGELTIEGAAVRINDPTGRFGKKQTAGFDDRFCVDPDNPTIRAATGFPMCIPRSNPADGDDPLCPVSTQRSVSAGVPDVSIQMNDPGNNPDPLKMVPFMVGDFVTYAGVTTGAGFFAAYEIVSNVAVYTKPGVDPAYTVFEVAITPTGGLNVAGAQEAATRSRYEGFTTDPTRPVHIWGLDFSFKDGSFVKRDLGQVMPDPGAPAGAVRGRWRIQPPCGQVGPLDGNSVFTNNNKGCVPPAAGIYTPPTREVMVEVWNCTAVQGTANNITSGDAPPGYGGCMYRSPTIEYLWPENVPGTPIVANNFQTLPFLVRGGYTSAKGTLVSGLDPWPSDTLPADSCKAPTITFDPTLSASSGGNLLLSATVTGPGSPFTYHWQALDPASGGTSADYTLLSAKFTNVTADASGNSTSYTLTVTNGCGFANSANVTVAVGAAGSDTLLTLQPTTVPSGTATVNITATLSGAAPRLFDWTLPVGLAYKAQQPFADIPTVNSTIFFSAPILPPTATVAQQFVVNVTAGGTAKTSAVVVVTPGGSDTVTVTAVKLVCTKHKLTITATDSVNTPDVKLTLQPYMDNNGKMFNPAPLGNTFTNLGTGTHTITISSAPLPSLSVNSLIVTSNLGGASAPARLLQGAITGTCTI